MGSDQVSIGLYNVLLPYLYSSTSTTATPLCATTATDIKPVDQNGTVTFDLTSIARNWYNGGDNYGIALKSTSTGSDYAVFYSTKFIMDYKPTYVIRYRSARGLSSVYSYEEIDMGTAGTAYINRLTGNLVIKRDDISADGTTVSGIYNSRNADDNDILYNKFYRNQMKSGDGWQFSVQEKMSGLANITDTPFYGSSEYLYLYTDGTGMRYYMLYDEDESTDAIKVMHDAEGTGLTLTWSTQRDYNSYFILEDAEQSYIKEYDGAGYIMKTTYTMGTESITDDVVLSYTYILGDGTPQSTDRRISYITNETSGEFLDFNYIPSDVLRVESVSLKSSLNAAASFQNRWYAYPNGTKLKIVYIYMDEVYTYTCNYEYNDSFMSKSTDLVNNTRVEFTYSNNKVSSVQCYNTTSGGTPVKSVVITYNDDGSVNYAVTETGNTTYTDYFFNTEGILTQTQLVDINGNPI